MKTVDIAQLLRDQVDKKHFVDAGLEAAKALGFNKSRYRTAIGMLAHEGYRIFYVRVKQTGNNLERTIKVLCKPGTTWLEAHVHRHSVKPIEL